MLSPIRSLRQMRATRRLLLVFVVAILAPGLILGVLGVRALVQESGLADRRLHETLAAAAENAGHRLESELKDWQHAIDDVARSGTSDPSHWPERIQRALASPDAVVLLGSRERPQAVPAAQLLYDPSIPSSEDAPVTVLSPLVIRAQALELREKQYEPAVATYRQSLPFVRGAERALVLNGLGRTLKKAGHADEAHAIYEQLAQAPPSRIGVLPSDLVALYELARVSSESERSARATQLFEGLVGGRWHITRASYAFYADEAHRWLAGDASRSPLLQDEQRKLTLTRAAERFIDRLHPLEVRDGSPWIAFSSEEPFAMIVLGPQFVRGGFLPDVRTSDWTSRLTTSDGQLLAGSAIPAGRTSASYTLQGPALPAQLQLWPTNEDTMTAGIRRQTRLSVGMVAIVLMLLAFGGYFTLRTVKSELAVAQMKADFVSVVSHEFRSPLTGINQLGEVLRDGRIENEARRHEYYEMIVGETQRLRRLVENVLDFARMEDGRKQYRFAPVDTTEWLREITREFQSQVATRGFTVESSIPDGLPAIHADRESLSTAVQNLLDNAVKYSPRTKQVWIDAASERGVLRVSVRDQGVGIRDADRPRIFEKFYRGSGEITQRVKGVGLGLNLVQHIVAAHGGSVDFESREGEGSTFTIRLNHDTHPAG
jgi:signal transduction histidine kinase/tetratricopeptide (TPR) repeat protein